MDELNSFGEVVFEENDVYGPLFCKVAALPQSEIRLTNEIKDAIKKSLGKLSREYLKDPCDKSLFNILVFWKLIKGRKRTSRKQMIQNIIKLGNGMAKEMLQERISGMKFNEAVEATTQEEIRDDEEELFLSEKEIARAIKLMERGQMSKAAVIVEKQTRGVASISAEVITKLKELNPLGQPIPFVGWGGSTKVIVGDSDILAAMVKDLNLQASAGMDGWTPAMLQLCYGEQNDGDGDRKDFRNFLTVFYLSMAVGTAPGAQMVTAARLTPLHKLSGGIRL